MPSHRKTVALCVLSVSTIAGTLVSVTSLWSRMARESEQRAQLEEQQVQLDRLREQIDLIEQSVNQRAEQK